MQPNKPNNDTKQPFVEGRISSREMQARKLIKQNGDKGKAPSRKVSRGQALRAQKQAVSDANRIANQYLDASAKPTDTKPTDRGRANKIDDSPRLKIIGLGGLDEGGA